MLPNNRFAPILFFVMLLVVACQQDKPSSTVDTKNHSSSNLFTEILATQSGIEFSNSLQETPQINRLNYEYFYNGGGVAVGDINNDGLQDIYLVGNMTPDKLYLNKGDFKFEDITERAGFKFENDWHTGVTMADINADGFLDIYVTRSGWFTDAGKLSNQLYLNNGDNTFTESAAKFGLADAGYGVQATFFDADLDGDLDAIVLNNPAKKPTEKSVEKYAKATASGAFMSDVFYKNDNGKFTNATKSSGLNTFGYRHGISVGDINNDGYPDLYISGDFDDPDYLYVNDKDGTFTNRILDMTRHTSMFSMGNDMADINNDGYLDIFVADMTPGDHERSKQNMASMNPEKFYQLVSANYGHQYMMNTMQLNNGGSTFSQISHLAGIANTDWSWSTLFLDWDLDGHDDLFVSNGVKRDVLNNDARLKASKLVQEQQRPSIMQVLNLMPSNKIHDYFYKNNGDLTFSDQSTAWLGEKAFNSNGAAYADLNNDGALDLIINHVDDKASIIKNNHSGNFLKVAFKGPKNNPFALGARATINTPSGKQNKYVSNARGFCSSMPAQLHFGLGSSTAISSIDVEFEGKTFSFPVAEINTLVTLDLTKGGKSSKAPLAIKPFTKVTPASLGISYTHEENAHNDFEKEILLPQRYSKNGPCLATGDFNGDGLDDMFFGGAKGQPAKLYRQLSNGAFSGLLSRAIESDADFEDTGAISFDANGDGHLDIYVVSGGNESPHGNSRYQDRLYLGDGKGEFSKSANVPAILTSGKAIAAADIDADGDMDLFRGGRLQAGAYPIKPTSYILTNQKGKLTKKEVLSDVQGLITDASFYDVDADGDQDLVVVGEWMPVTIVLNNGGEFTETKTIGEAGWFQSVMVGDFNNDGQTDILAGNIGLNNKFHPSKKKPLHVFAHDFDKNGQLDIVLSKLYKGKKVPVRGRECSSEQMPFLKQKFPTFQEFSEADLEEMYGAELDKALHLEATNFAHMVYFSVMNKYRGEQLPNSLQRGPILSITPMTWDNAPAYILAGNHFDTEVETSRYDGSAGGIIQFQDSKVVEVPFVSSGLSLHANIKDAAIMTQKKDKKLYVAVPNDDEPIIYRLP